MSVCNLFMNSQMSVQISGSFQMPLNAPLPNPQFEGRDALLDELRKMLCDRRHGRYNHCVALHGLGGVGKTQLAVQYICRFHQFYKLILWVSAADKSILAEGFKDIRDRYHCVESGTAAILSPQAIVNVVALWLREQTDWLLVLDNLDDMNVVEGLNLPRPQDRGHILITTRNPNAHGMLAEGLEVALLDSDAAVKLLIATSAVSVDQSNSDRINSEALEIVEKLGELPLAIVQAGAYIREVLHDTHSYLEAYNHEHHRKKLLNRKPDGIWYYKYTVRTTWLMSFAKIKEMDAAAARLLQLFSYLNPDDILLEFLQDGCEGLRQDRELLATVRDTLSLRETLAVLRRFSFIQWADSLRSVSIHRLVQEVIRDEMTDVEVASFKKMALALFEAAFPSLSNIDQELYARCRRFRNQVLQPFLNHVSNDTSSSKALTLSTHLGYYLRNDGLFRESLRVLQKGLKIASYIPGWDISANLELVKSSGVCFMGLGRLAHAITVLKKGVDTARRLTGPKTEITLNMMCDLAMVYYDNQELEKAREMQEVVYAAYLRKVGRQDVTTLRNMNNLANTYTGLGRLQESKEMLEEIIETTRKLFDDEDPDVLEFENSLAEVYRADGSFCEARDLHLKSLQARENVLGPEHPLTLCSMHDLALTYRDLGCLELSRDIEQRTLNSRRRILGDDHPHTVSSLNCLADVLCDLGMQEEGEKLLKNFAETKSRTWVDKNSNVKCFGCRDANIRMEMCQMKSKPACGKRY